MKSALFIPSGKFRSPALKVGPHQVAELADFLLCIELGAQVHEVQEGSQTEAHHKVLAVIKRKNAAGMLFGEAGAQSIPIAFGRLPAELQILRPQRLAVGVFLALAIAVIPHWPEVENIFQIQFSIGSSGNALARIAHGLHIEAHTHPMGAGLLHHRVGKPAHVQHDLGMLERTVVASLAGE